MGIQNIAIATNPEARKVFLRHLIDDVQALQQMLDEELFESGITRIGAEQEFCLVNSFYKPSRNNLRVLETIGDRHFTTELARYNLEINLDPVELKAGAIDGMAAQLKEMLEKADRGAALHGEKVVLAGILPSIDYRCVQLDYLTPRDRYRALDTMLKNLRGGEFELNISGVDELIIKHRNILFEACNTSFQMHYQVNPAEFVQKYNWAQAIAGPVLSVCTNSPLLIGRQLWAETRIPLFQQSIDTRSIGFHMRERQQRVTFGNKWISVPTDVYKSDIARHTILFSTDIEKSSLQVLREGGIPKLRALMLHNGTVYKWNRPCYGVSGGVPHLRIENRYLPSGPTQADEMANMAFWAGLMHGMPERYSEIEKMMPFEHAKENFQKAAMWGIGSIMWWEGEHIAAKRLVTDKLIPIADEGLAKAGVPEEERFRWLSIVLRRTASYHTGSRWMLGSFRKLRKDLSRDEACTALTAILYKRQQSGEVVSKWKTAETKELEGIRMRYEIAGNAMTTDLITVQEHDLADMVQRIMSWRNIRHLPVEDNDGRLLGLITKAGLTAWLQANPDQPFATAADVMQRDPLTISAGMEIEAALDLMERNNLSCLPVVTEGLLAGLITDKDAAKIRSRHRLISDNEDNDTTPEG
ncbi:MAG: CBS domain-containing protein [Balneolales bacterium]|nr:CBS domain-containing protein [Balneolales bacterium]